MGDAGDRIEQRDRLRDEALPHDTVVVLRGGPDTVTKIVRHARRTEQRWAPAGKLRAAGFELLPTVGRPHYTIRMRSGDEAEAAKLLAVLGPPRENWHHESHVR